MLGERVQFMERSLYLAIQDSTTEFEELALGGEAEHGEHVRFLDLIAAKTDELVEGAFGVTHAAIRTTRNGEKRGVFNLHFLFLGDFRELFDDEYGGDPAQVESLAA